MAGVVNNAENVQSSLNSPRRHQQMDENYRRNQPQTHRHFPQNNAGFRQFPQHINRRPFNQSDGPVGNRRNFRQRGFPSRHEDRRDVFNPQRKDHAGVKMICKVSDCLICCQRSDLYGIGECLHPICMECIIRIRISDQNPTKLCPQCRTELETIYFISSPPGQELIPKIPSPPFQSYQDDEKYGVRFTDGYAKECFDSYMANKCNICLKMGDEATFTSFSSLVQHMVQVHDRSFCRICCDNLNVLTKDRKVYTRDELEKHYKGELSNEIGFQGHPTCMFCDQRFYDEEHRYKHLRRDHTFCQMCDEDGRDNVFYRNQEALNRHNKKMHKPCLDSECLLVGIVFGTEEELALHKARNHNLSTGNRSIPVGLNFRRGTSSTNFGRQAHSTEETAIRTPTLPEVYSIVPSAQHRTQLPRIIPSASFTSTNSASEYTSLLQPNQFGPPPGYGAPPPGFSHLCSKTRSNQQGRNLTIQSADQFPSLGENSSYKPQQDNTSFWAIGSKELFKNKPEKPKAEEIKRKKFIPAPDIWPEHMQDKMKARELGLPDPDPIKPQHWEVEKEKEKKSKKKTKGLSAEVAEKLAHEKDAGIVPSNSKFDALSTYDESNENKSAIGSADWWKNGVRGPKLTPTRDGFVQISFPDNSAGMTNGSTNFSLRSIAEMLTHSNNDDADNKEQLKNVNLLNNADDSGDEWFQASENQQI